MLRGPAIWIVIALTLGLCTSCDMEKLEKRGKLHASLDPQVRDLFREWATSDAPAKELGISEVQFFGEGRNPSGKLDPTVHMTESDSGHFDLSATLWCTGQRPDGRTEKLTCTIRARADGSGQLLNETVSLTTEPLSLGSQLKSWSLEVLWYTALIALGFFEANGIQEKAGLFLMASLPVAAITGPHYFVSWLLFLGCIAAWLPFVAVGGLLFSDRVDLLALWAKVMAVAGITGLILLLFFWKVVPYVVESSAIWWRWLIGHFAG